MKIPPKHGKNKNLVMAIYYISLKSFNFKEYFKILALLFSILFKFITGKPYFPGRFEILTPLTVYIF